MYQLEDASEIKPDGSVAMRTRIKIGIRLEVIKPIRMLQSYILSEIEKVSKFSFNNVIAANFDRTFKRCLQIHDE